MMKIYICVLLVVFPIIICLSQEKISNKEIDSIYKIINTDSFYNKEGVARATELYNQSKENNYVKGQIMTLRRLADIEGGSSNYAKSYEHIKKLQELTLSVKDYENYITASCLESKILFIDRNYSEAKNVLNSASSYLENIEDTEIRRKSKIDIYLYKWWAIKYSEFPVDSYKDSLVHISKIMCSEALLLKNKKYRINRTLFSATYTASILISLNKLDEAEKYLNIAKSQAKEAGPEQFASVDYLEAKGDYEYKNKIKNTYYLDSALVYYNKAMTISKKLEYASMIKQLLPKIAKIYGDKKDFEKLNLFNEKAQVINDSLKRQSNINLNELKQKVYNIKKADDNSISTTVILFILFIIFLVISSAILYKKYFKIRDNRNKNNTAQSEKEPKNISVSQLLALLEKNDNSFYLAFMETYPDFAKKLLQINPTMKSSDIEFCAFIKLNLETKQIAQLENISVRAVESKKYRIRKKLNITIEENMYLWMSNI